MLNGIPLRSAGLALGLFLGPGFAAAGPFLSASATPSWVEAHHPFTLILEGQSQSCALRFSHQEARLTGGKLVLSVLAQSQPGILCAKAPTYQYRVEFTAPALDTGAYPVQARWAQACEFDPTPCPVAYDPQDVGNLQVTDSAHLDYHFSPRAVPAGQAFRMLLRGGAGCGDRITAQSVDTARPSLTLDFTVSSPGAQCDTIVPGLEFPVPALQAGIWQVYVWRTPDCPPGSLCPVLTPAPRLAGALEVKAETAALVPANPDSRLKAARPRGAGFHVEWQGAARDAAGRRDPEDPDPRAPR